MQELHSSLCEITNNYLRVPYTKLDKSMKESPKTEQIPVYTHKPIQNDYTSYFEPLLPEVEIPQAEPLIKYTVHIHKAMFTDELFELYKKYEKAVHNRDVNESNLKTHLCNSPVYHPIFEKDTLGSQHSKLDVTELDRDRGFQDEGVDPPY